VKKTIVRAVSTAAFLSTVYAGSAYASTHTVEKGDSLWKIAKKYQTTVSELKSLNNLESDFLQVNQKLKISAVAAAETAEKTASKPASTTVSATSVYVVKKGDYLGKIANQFSTSVAALKSINRLTSDMIFVGQKVKIPGKMEVTLPSKKTVTPAPAISSTTSSYTVVGGDTLSKIGLEHKMSVQALKKLNNLKSDMIYVGQKLKVSGKKAVTPAPATPKPSTVKPVVKPVVNNGNSSVYIVKSGDTLGKISLQYDMTVQEIKALNGMKSDFLSIGQKLKVSGKKKEEVKPPAAPAPSGDFAADFINVAKSVMGTPYVWGGSSVNGFDCSGIIYYAANKAGKEIGRTSAEGYYNRTFYVDQPQPGDLVFFENTYKKGISHVGIYLGGDEFIHADEKRGISVANLSNPYYKEHFASFKRFY
jgi:LysM repeat protein